MARHESCGEDDGVFPVEKYGDDPVLGDALERLADVLDGLPDPLGAAVTELTPADVAALIRPMPLFARKGMLQHLGMGRMTPRQIPQALCRDIVARMKSRRAHDRWHAAFQLTVPVWIALVDGTAAADDEPATVLDRWADHVLRVGLWSHLTASRTSARVLAWVAGIGGTWWLPDSCAAEHGELVVAAAQAVIDASPDWRIPLRDHDHSDDEHSAGEHDAESGVSARPSAEKHDDSSATDTGRGEMTTGTGGTEDMSDTDPVVVVVGNSARALPAGVEAESTPPAGPGDAKPVPDAADLVAWAPGARAAFVAAQDAAAAALNELGQAVSAGARVPDVALTSVRAYAQQAGEMLTRAGSVPDLAAFDDAVAQARATMKRAPFARLSRLTVTGATTAADVAAARVRDLAAAGGGDHVDGLTALADLVDLTVEHGPGADQAKLMELQQRAFALPPDLLPLVGAATFGQLSFTDPAAPAADEDSEPGPNQTEPTQTDPAPVEASAVAPREAREAVDDERAAGRAAEQAPALAITEPAIENPEPASAPTSSAFDTTALDASAPSETAPPAPVAGPTPVRDTTPSTTAEPSEPSDEHVEDAMSELINTGHLGLAAILTDTADPDPDRAAALRIAALAGQVRGDTSPAAVRIHALLDDANDLGSSEPTLTLATPALLRTALTTGDHTCGALLANLAQRLTGHLSAIAAEAGRVTLAGVLVGGALRTTVTDLSELDNAVESARQAATELLRPRTMRFKRASDIVNDWLKPGGRLAVLLEVAANDDRTQAPWAAAEIHAVSTRDTVKTMIDAGDSKYRGHSGKPLEGQGRQDLVHLIDNVLDVVAGWVDAVTARESVKVTDTWAATEVGALRTAARTHGPAALAELEQKQSSGRPVTAAAARAARTLLDDALALLEGTATTAPDIPVEALLTGDLLKVPGAVADPVTRTVTLTGAPSVAELVAAAGVDWVEAFEAKLTAEDYPAAEVIVDGCANGTLPDAADLGPDARARLDMARQSSRRELATLRASVSDELRRARMNSVLSVEQETDLSDVLAGADPDGRDDLGHVRSRLTVLEQRLPRYRQQAAERLAGRLSNLISDGSLDSGDKIAVLIASGELATAEELIINAEAGEEMPEKTVREDFDVFYPAVPDALPNGITPALLQAVSDRGQVRGCPVLDYAELSPDAAADAAVALEQWRLAGATPVPGRRSLPDHQYLKPALRLAGYDLTRSGNARVAVHDRDKRVFEFSDVAFNGKAMLPQFGSGLGGRLRVMVVWGQPDAQLLASFVEADPAKETIVVAYLGTMSLATRREFAVRALSLDVAVLVLDDAALAYLAAHGSRQLYATLACLAPFTGVQPYAREKRNTRVPKEMFYGRDTERRDVMNMRGPQIVYGGRGLGKSALLRDAQASFVESREGSRVAIYADLKSTVIGPDQHPASEIWPVIHRALKEAGIVTETRRSAQRPVSYDGVRSAIRDWLVADNRRELLLLLDETDQFLEVDAPHFAETNKLKELSGLAGAEDRAKVVFAGLHSVQRFSNVPNQTFKHLAQTPIVIGPLAPKYAYNLLVRPLQVLGYSIRDDLAYRILGYCSYQPFLLQMFAHRLLEQMHEQRKAGLGAGQPPYEISDADVSAVEENPDLRKGIAETFEDTLKLDPRYFVIANVLAAHADENGLESRVRDLDLREECRSWWAPGFDSLDLEGFRTYLQEMVGLGVLGSNSDQRGWRLRSSNTLRMIGTREQVEENLISAHERQVPPGFAALAARRTLANSSTAPLTAQQVVALLGAHTNQVRVVLGSTATGIEKVTATLSEVCTGGAEGYTLVPVTDRRGLAVALTDGIAGTKRVVLDDVHDRQTSVDSAVAALESATSTVPTAPGVTRAVVIVAGPGQQPLWQAALAAGVAVPLTRFDSASLRVWTLDDGRPFNGEDIKERLLAVTGGWPKLVDDAAAAVGNNGREEKALEQVAARLATSSGAADFLDWTGVTADTSLVAALAAILEWTDGAPHPWAYLVDAAAEAPGLGHDSALAVECLEALGMFDVLADGSYQVTPTVTTAWPHRRA